MWLNSETGGTETNRPVAAFSVNVKYWLLPLPALFLLALSACGDGEKIPLTFQNNTDALICWYQDETAEGPKGSCTKIGPMETITIDKSCSGDEEVRVIIAEGKDGEISYRRKATCPTWTGATITIDRDGERLAVTDSFDSN